MLRRTVRSALALWIGSGAAWHVEGQVAPGAHGGLGGFRSVFPEASATLAEPGRLVPPGLGGADLAGGTFLPAGRFEAALEDDGARPNGPSLVVLGTFGGALGGILGAALGPSMLHAGDEARPSFWKAAAVGAVAGAAVATTWCVIRKCDWSAPAPRQPRPPPWLGWRGQHAPSAAGPSWTPPSGCPGILRPGPGGAIRGRARGIRP